MALSTILSNKTMKSVGVGQPADETDIVAERNDLQILSSVADIVYLKGFFSSSKQNKTYYILLNTQVAPRSGGRLGEQGVDHTYA